MFRKRKMKVVHVVIISLCLLVAACSDKVKENDMNEAIDNTSFKVIATKKDGKYHGQYALVDTKGNIIESGIMIEGMKNGVWKYYNDEGSLKKVLQYYNDSVVFELDKSDFSLLSFNIDNDQFVIDIPINWGTEVKRDSRILLISKKKCDSSYVFCPNMTITKETLNEDIELVNYLNASLNTLRQKMQNLKIVNKGEVIINGFPSYQLTYTAEFNNTKLGGLITWIRKDDDIYIITGMAMNENSAFLKYKGLYQEVALSFKYL